MEFYNRVLFKGTMGFCHRVLLKTTPSIFRSGFLQLYDFCYLPRDFKCSENKGCDEATDVSIS